VITDKLIPSPFTLKIDVHALDAGYLVEVEGRRQTGFSPELRRFAVEDLAAVGPRVHQEVTRFLSSLVRVITERPDKASE